MRIRGKARTRAVRLVLAVALLASGACATTSSGTVTVMASWTGSEEDAFREVLDRFEAATGIGYEYRGTRAVDQVLAADVQRDAAPDVAVLPNPSVLAAYARQGELHPLDEVLGDQSGSYGPQWLTLQRVGRDRQYAVAVKADVKSTIWYATANADWPTPVTWEELVALSRRLGAEGRTPWCLGMGSPPVSGWPGTDWVEDILLHSAGPEVHREWASGRLAWTSPQVRQAWQAWGELVASPGAVRGGAQAALLTDFDDAGRALFANPPGCLLEYQASFAMGGYQAVEREGGSTPRPGADFDFFPFPGGRVSSVSADLAGMFHDTPEARALIKFLASDEAQRIWPEMRGGSVFSANKTVTDVYDDDLSRRIARRLTTDPLCLDASDLMPARMTDAFYRAVLEYLHAPARLDALLADLDEVRASLNDPGQWLDVPCGQ
ncbi:ABC transporter substrate-binding protein [Actinosynnema sp. CA-299493]